MDMEIGISGVLLRILFYFEAHRCSRQTGSVYTLGNNLLNIMIQKTLLRGRGTSIIIKLNESNKEVKIKKKTRSCVDSNTGPLGCKLCTKTTCLVNSTVLKRFIFCISSCKILVKLTVNTKSRQKVKKACALTVKLCSCVRLIKSDNILEQNLEFI